MSRLKLTLKRTFRGLWRNPNFVKLWTSLGFTVLGTVPEAFDHPRHGPVGLHIMYKAL